MAWGGEELSSNFKAYFKAFRNYFPRTGAYYDIAGTYIYIPERNIDPSSIFEFLHESSHARQGNSVLGMTAQALGELLSSVEERIFAVLREKVLKLIKPPPGVKSPLYYILYTYGEVYTSDRKGSLGMQQVPNLLKEEFKQIALEKNFWCLLEVFHEIDFRLRSICSSWRSVHEGVAVFDAINMCLSDDEYSKSMVIEAITELGGQEEDIGRLNEELLILGEKEKRRWERGVGCGKRYLKGFQICDRLSKKAGGRAAVWVASLAASHFPYESCDLLDMPVNEFDQWVKRGKLNFQRRFERLGDNTKLIKEIVREIEKTHMLSEETMELALDCACGGQKPLPLSKEEKLFGVWERHRIYGSELVEKFFSAIGTKIESIEGLDRLKVLDDDRTRDFRIPGQWKPPVIDGNEKVTGVSPGIRERGMRRFIKGYEVDRTRRLIRSLGTS